MNRGIVKLSAGLLLAVIVFGAGAIGWRLRYSHHPQDVSDRQAAIALEIALEKLGDPYVWGARGPDSFDSSGIIVYAYQQAVPYTAFRVGDGWWPGYSPNANHRDIYTWNFREMPLDDLRPGDLVYISDGSADVTHGMFFVGWEADGIMEVLDASSRLMRVARQTWPVEGEVRGQKFVAAGRLQINAREEWLRHEPEAP